MDENEDDCTSEQLAELAVAEELVARIDSAILSHTQKEFRKVASIVHLAMKSIADAPESVTECFYLQRVLHLVRVGKLQSQGNLNRMRFSEIRLPSRPLTATELEELAAQGDYWKLGSIYAQGQGVAQDYVSALKWFRIAAERGHVWAQYNVGRLYMDGAGVKKSLEDAYFWIALALSGSADKGMLGNWLAKVGAELPPSVREQLDKRVAAWRPTIGFTG